MAKNTVLVLVPCPAWKCVPTATGGVDVSEFLVRVTKITSKIGVL